MSSDPHPTPDQAAKDEALFHDYLLALLDAGHTIVQNLKRQAEAEPPQGEPPHPARDLSEQFERVSRAMRRTILLARHIAQPPPATPRDANQRTAARKRIIRQVQDAIQLKAKDPEAGEAELLDRLDSPDLDEEIASRPVPDIITDIIRDLGLAHMPGTHPWKRRTPEDIEQLRQTAATPTPPGPYTPAPHPRTSHGPEKPKRRPHPPDPDEEAKHLIALAKMLSGT